MEIFIDLHTHTIASGHVTTNTITDMARRASELGFTHLAITDHSPTTVGSANENYFVSLQHCDKKLFGVNMLYGCEIDIVGTNGKLGLSTRAMQNLDITLCSLHLPTFPPQDRQTNTKAIINAISTGVIDIVAHADDSRYSLDYEALVVACKQHKVAMEINNSSLEPNSYRTNAQPNDRLILELCKQYNVPISLGSDGHGIEWLGNFRHALPLIKEAQFPHERILNCNKQLLFSHLSYHKAIRQQLK